MTGSETGRPERRRDRLWRTRIELGPAFFFFAAWNWVNWVAVPHAGDAIREQRLLVGFLWFAAAMVLFCGAGLTAFSSVRRLKEPGAVSDCPSTQRPD